MPVNDTYNGNAGVLSMFEGIGNAISDVGKIGLMDHLETRRAEKELALKKMLKGDDYGHDIKMEGIKSKNAMALQDKKIAGDIDIAKASAGSKFDPDKYPYIKEGTPLTASAVLDAYKAEKGIASDSYVIPKDGIEDYENWKKRNGYILRNKPAPKPKQPVTEDAYRAGFPALYEKQTGEKPSPELIDEYVKRQRDAGLIVDAPGNVPRETNESATAGVLDETEAVVGESNNPELSSAIDAAKSRPSVGSAALKNKLEQFKSEVMVQSASGATAGRKKSEKMREAAMKVDAAIKKGNIKQVSKDNIAIALNNAAWVDGLTDDQVQQIIQYMSE